MISWVARHRILTWAVAWGLSGIGFFTADIFSSPRRGPLWVAIVCGLVAWSVAGAVTLHRTHLIRGAVIWAVAYGAAFWLGAMWGERFESTGSGGFVGALFGWAVGAAIGVLASAYVHVSQRTGTGPVVVAAAWALSFFIAGYVAVVAGLLLSHAGKDVLFFIGQRPALAMGWALGAALGGALASALGMAASDAVVGLPSEAV